jgi:hypothetical protein
MTHDELISAYCKEGDHSHWMFWCEPTLGMHSERIAKPDILMINKSWSNYEVRIIEVKVSQSDLNQDVKSLKFEKYFPWAHRVSFLLGEGLKDDILKDHPVGIIKKTKTGFNTRKAAPRIKHQNLATDMTTSWDLFHALNMGETRYMQNLRIDRVRRANEWLELATHPKTWNERHRIHSKNLRNLIEKAQEAHESPEKVISGIKKKYQAELKKTLGLSSWADIDSSAELLNEVFRNCFYEFKRELSNKVEILEKEFELKNELTAPPVQKEAEA